MDLKFDVKEKVEELVKKLQSDPSLLKNFEQDPIKTIEKLVGVDLPDEKIQPLIAGIKVANKGCETRSCPQRIINTAMGLLQNTTHVSWLEYKERESA